jgi:hypothetical protein
MVWHFIIINRNKNNIIIFTVVNNYYNSKIMKKQKKLNFIYFKQFLFETFYCLALISEVVGLSFSFKVW